MALETMRILKILVSVVQFRPWPPFPWQAPSSTNPMPSKGFWACGRSLLSPMATIYRRGPRWHALIRRKELKTTDKSFETRKVAVIWARDIESKIDRGIVNDITKAARITIADLFDRYETETAPYKHNSRCERDMLMMLKSKVALVLKARIRKQNWQLLDLSHSVWANTFHLKIGGP